MTNKTENGDILLSDLPLKKTWLDDIVDVFLHRSKGIAEIDAVTNEILKTPRNARKETAATITRTINNHCENAQDSEKKVKHPIFRRIAPATYQLLTYPERPNLIDIQNIEFNEYAYIRLWADFRELANNREPKKWAAMSNSAKLEAFVRFLRKPSAQNMLEAYRKTNELPIGDLEI